MHHGPPSVPAYMLSLLRHRCVEQAATFARTYAGWWLVWEPGPWRSSGVYEPTHSPSGNASHGVGADTLAFHLKATRPLKVGRSPAADIVINDATVSREHLLLTPRGDEWSVDVISTLGATELDSLPLAPQSSTKLSLHARLRLGDAYLSFLDAASLQERLREPQR